MTAGGDQLMLWEPDPTSPWDLLRDDPDPDLVGRLVDRRRAAVAAGPGRLLRDLVKAGLPEEHLAGAAALVIALDEAARR